jgi:hypothetical protein
MTYLLTAYPFDTPYLNRLELFNEISTLLSSMHLLALTDFNSDPEVYYNVVGWSLIVITTYLQLGRQHLHHPAFHLEKPQSHPCQALDAQIQYLERPPLAE